MQCLAWQKSQVSQPHLMSSSSHQSEKSTSQKYNELATNRTNVSNVSAQVHPMGFREFKITESPHTDIWR